MPDWSQVRCFDQMLEMATGFAAAGSFEELAEKRSAFSTALRAARRVKADIQKAINDLRAASTANKRKAAAALEQDAKKKAKEAEEEQAKDAATGAKSGRNKKTEAATTSAEIARRDLERIQRGGIARGGRGGKGRGRED